MTEVTGDIWAYWGRRVIAITTNGHTTGDGRAVFGRGCARQAAERFPELAHRLGRLLLEGGNHVHYLGDGLVTFPVEESPWSVPDLHVIERSARELRELADNERWEQIVVPRPGCGGGGLSWNEVKPLLLDHFDERFAIITAG